MKVDLLVTTYKRLDDLLILLKNLELQRYKNFRLQIFDGTPDSSVELAVFDYLSTRENEQKYELIYHKTTCGMTKQRNLAVNATEGDISIFLDDDVELDENYLKEIVRVFELDTEFKIAGINGFDEFNFSNNRKIGKRKQIYRFLGLYPNVGPAKYLPWGHSTAHFVSLKKDIEDVDILIGHNMAFRTFILKRIKFDGFFEQYNTYVLYDDQDISLRMKLAGYRLVISYDARLIHKIAPSGRPAAKHYGYQAFFNAYRNWKIFGSQNLPDKIKFWLWEILDVIFQLPFKNTRDMAVGRLEILTKTLFGLTKMK